MTLLYEVTLRLHELSAKYPPVSWLIHGIFAIPLALIGPWTPGAVFLYREAEQALHAHAHALAGQRFTPAVAFDRVMDVLVPLGVGLALG